MTAQTGDILKVCVGTSKEDHYSLACEPLKPYLEGLKEPIRFYPPDTGLMRGYVAEWQIDKDDRLMLIDFKGWRTDGMAKGVGFLFSGETRVFARWYSGEITVPQGKLLDYIHVGYHSLYERDLIIEIKEGIVVKKYVVDNYDKLQERIEWRRKAEKEKQQYNSQRKTRKYIINIVGSFLSILLFAWTFSFWKEAVKNSFSAMQLMKVVVVADWLVILGGVLHYHMYKKDEKKQEKSLEVIVIGVLTLFLTLIWSEILV